MGADLCTSFLEMNKGKTPNWDKAKARVQSLAAEIAVKICLEIDGTDTAEVAAATGTAPRPHDVEVARIRILDAIKAAENGWSGYHREMAPLYGARTVILLAAGLSWGDRIDSVVDLQLFEACGAAEAAGFLVGKNLRSKRRSEKKKKRRGRK